jgi:hypothetical protein
MVSGVLHERIEEGDLIDVAPPMGDFVLDEAAQAPAVLLSAGVGITPMMAMLEQLLRRAPQRPVHFLHAARHGGAHAFGARLRELAARHRQLSARVYYETPRPQDEAGRHFDQAGRIELTRAGRCAGRGRAVLPVRAAWLHAGAAPGLARGRGARGAHPCRGLWHRRRLIGPNALCCDLIEALAGPPPPCSSRTSPTWACAC